MTDADPAEPRTRYTFSVGPAYDDVMPAFVIDSADYDDHEAVRAQVREASEVLDANNVIAEMVTETVRPGTQRPALPSWPEFRERHVVGGRVDQTVPTASGFRSPGGWERMQADLERARAILRENLLAMARSIIPGVEPSVVSDRGPERHGQGSQDLSRERYGAIVTIGFRLGDEGIDEVMATATAVFDELGWQTEEPRHDGSTHRLEAVRSGYSVLLSVEERWRTATLLGQTPLFQATETGSTRIDPTVVHMTERRVLSDQEIIDLVTKLRSLKWSWSPEEAERLVAEFGWTIMSSKTRSLLLETEFGMGTGRVEVNMSGRVERIDTAVSKPVPAETAEERAFVQDTFAHVVSVVTQALGEPTQRLPGENPEVRWRGPESTIVVHNLSVQVDVYLATNKWIDDYDWAVSRGL